MATKSIPSVKSISINEVGPHVNETLRADADPAFPTIEESLAQIERLVGSPLFLGSEALCKLLKYLADHTIHSPADHLKEYQIATEVFGRPSDFDPQSDSCVRVQMGRLRSKLAHYYETEGAADPVLVDVPKGRYIVSFESRVVPVDSSPVSPALTVQVSEPEPDRPALFTPMRRALLATAAVLLAILGLLYLVFRPLRTVQPSVSASPGPVQGSSLFSAFWAPFLQGPEEPFVVFANANFVGNADTGMRYYDASRDPQDKITQHYTGVGEVVGVLELDRLFGKFGRQFRVKRGGLFTLDDARTNNLIFVGSPTENLTLGQIRGTQEFIFKRVSADGSQWRQVIVNMHPQPGESNVYPPSSEPAGDGADYAVIALLPGLTPSRWTLILAGASTIGTQAAVDYVCDQGSVDTILLRLNVSRTADLRPFEALLRVKVAHDVPLETQIVALRPVGR